ncbi:MAG: hypothetical protein A2901_05065 [Elusimicrobia bacterium RIFCSPLOWO2_01_FULL_54_10]|nr:MAG: hypothetical protein A2901_05065 [Elusimicrobia bacterium RIFCSPLOWO2_01_FULL_54_10]
MLIPWAAYALFAWAFMHAPEKPALLFSLFLPLILWIYHTHESALESPSIPWLLAGYSALLIFIFFHPARAGFADTLSLILQWVIIGACAVMAVVQFDELQKEVLITRDKTDELSKAVKDKTKTNDFYRQKIPALKSKIGERKRLSTDAKEMGTLLDPGLIRKTLIEKVQNLFPAETVSLSPSVTAATAATAGKSSISTSLHSGKTLMGTLRVDSAARARFSETDMQQIEFYASLATLALENAKLFSEINALATRDGLTGLATQRIFLERLAEELLRGGRYRTPVALIMADIDHFKHVNDGHGHLAGDQVLKDVSQIFAGRIRPVDLAARYGGEEFCLVLPGLTLQESFGLAETLRREIEAREVLTGSARLKVTASFGCAAFPDDAQSASQLVRKADERLYKAKSQGRNRVINA